MTDPHGAVHLSAPRLSALRLQTLIAVLSDPGCRRVLARLLSDPWQRQGYAEYYAHDLDVALDLVDVPRRLVELRHAGWIHQRPAAYGLVSRLRRDDLELRFPDTMRSLRGSGRSLMRRPMNTEQIEARLEQLGR